MTAVQERPQTEPSLKGAERHKIALDLRRTIEITVRSWPESAPALAEAFFRGTTNSVSIKRGNAQIFISSGEEHSWTNDYEYNSLSLLIISPIGAGKRQKREIIKTTADVRRLNSYKDAGFFYYSGGQTEDGHRFDLFDMGNTHSLADKIKARLKEL